MTIRHGKNARVYIDGYVVLNDINTIGGVMENNLATYAVLDASGGYHHLQGLAKDTVAIKGFLDDTLQTILNALYAASTGYAVMILYGLTVGDPAIAASEVKIQRYLKEARVADINAIAADLVTDNLPFDDAKLLNLTQYTAQSGGGTTLDNGASSAAGAIAYLQVTEQTGGTGCTISIRHSSDNFVGNDSELLAFTAFTGRTTERKIAAGTVKRYTRMYYVFTGNAPYTVTAIVVLKRN